MAEYIYKEIALRTQENLVACSCFVITCNKMTTMDSVAWISIHAYVVHDFASVSMLFALEKVTEEATAPRLAIAIMDAIEGKGGVSRSDMQRKWISICVDDPEVF